ncbi:MAG: transcriptional regulator, LuxR family [Thermoleophilia bacterium]|nr:transcriptional regulator, LuxR family [Thermoleophilia bacterium]
MHDFFCIGRDREIAQLDLSVGSGTDGLRIAMLSGPSGQGKTTLAGVAIQRATDRGYRVANVRGRAGSLSVPFQPFLDAMPEFDVLLDVITAGDGGVDIEHAGIGIVNLIAELADRQPLLLVFDDAQALDESSIALLPYLTGISETCNLTLLFVEQTDAIGVPSSYRAFIDGMLARRVVSHLRLGPLGDEAIRQIAAQVLEYEAPEMVPADLVLRAGGNPWFARELADGLRRGIDELPTSIAAAATARLHRLPETGQDLVYATALCPDGAHVGWLEALSGERPRAFVKLMELMADSGLIREDGEILTIAHPLMQQAIEDELSAAMRRAIHLELADIVATVQLAQVITARARGFHLAAAGRAHEAVLEFLSAAETNEINGQLHEAYADVTHALEAETRLDERIDLLRRCAGLAMQVDRTRAESYWIELGRISAARGDNETYAYALFQQYWTCNDGAARDRLERAAALGTDGFGWSARAGANIASLDGDFAEAERLDRIALQIAVSRGDDMLRTLTMHRLGVSLALLGRENESIAMLRDAVTSAIQHRLHGWAVYAWGDLTEMLSLAVRAEEALAEATSLQRYVEDLGLDRTRAISLGWLASATLRRGDLDAAHDASTSATLAAAHSWDAQASPLIAMVHAEVSVERNDTGAAAAVASAFEVAREAGNESWADQLEILRIRADSRGGSLTSAVQLLPEVLERTSEMHVRAEAVLWLARAAALIRDDAAIMVARTLRALIEPDVAYVNLATDELDAMFLAHESGDYAALEAVGNRWAAGGRMLDSARVSAVVGAIRLHRGDAAGAKDLLHAAKGALQGCGASGDADLVAALLRQTGARSRAKSRTTNVGPLTKRELEIARLVASGLKNSEVASSLFLAEKTVAAHLSNIYGKVEVRSRVQLGAWIREHDPEFEATLANAG